MESGDRCIVAPAFTPEANLKRNIRAHFAELGFVKKGDGTLGLPDTDKASIRQLHRVQRRERIHSAETLIRECLTDALECFANGSDIDVDKIDLKLIQVRSGTFNSKLFRIASLTWSVPVSYGYGRRLRYLVWDQGNNKLAGILALGDPVFNLNVRDKIIGWSGVERASRLVNVLDAYVLGAVPPYNMLLVGKAVACLIRSKEVYDDFASKYGNTTGIISGIDKRANLLAVTTSSSMGRSSIYNRLNLDGTTYFKSIGYTVGWGHFHIADDLFAQMRQYLRMVNHPYADHHKYGHGPNWRLRTVRTALQLLGISESLLKHGVQREVFLCPLALNAVSILGSGEGVPNLTSLKNVQEISSLAHQRWIEPRSRTRQEYKTWKKESILTLIGGQPIDNHLELVSLLGSWG